MTTNNTSSTLIEEIKEIFSDIDAQKYKDCKQKIISCFAKHEKDSGSSEVQILLITARVVYLTHHLKVNKKDFNTRRSLLILLAQRRSLISYLKRKMDSESYSGLITRLEALNVRIAESEKTK